MTLSTKVKSTRSKNYFATLEDRFNQKHGNKYSYTNAVYINSKEKLEIHCSIHGPFFQIPSDHLNGSGCPKCAVEKNINNLKMTLKEFKEKATKRHEGKYDYSDTKLGINNKDSVFIRCKVHGIFEASPNNHLRNSGGCPECKKEAHLKKEPTWSYTKWQKSGEQSEIFDSFKVYIVRCWSETEEFLKVGKTYCTIGKRLRFHLPYEYKVEEIYVGSARAMSELETSLKQNCKKYKYLPKKIFGGSTECFNKDSLNELKKTESTFMYIN